MPPAVRVTVVPSAGAGRFRVVVSVTASPPSAGALLLLSVSVVGELPPPSSSLMVTRTELGLPAVTDDGRLPSATVNVSSSVSASWFVVTVPVPFVEPELMVMLDSEP